MRGTPEGATGKNHQFDEELIITVADIARS